MRPRLTIVAVVVLLIAAATLYYFYGNRKQAIAADFKAVIEGTADAATTTAVKTALALNKQISAFDIHVKTSNHLETGNNNVTLTGQVPTIGDKRVAEEIARGTKGVADVVNNLQIISELQAINAEKPRVTDLEIKAAVLESILNNPDLKTQQIKVEVNNGEVTLSGKVQTPAQKTTAESAAWAIANVRDVNSKALAVMQV
jgi:hyperosmotically inducible periplasmic protein